MAKPFKAGPMKTWLDSLARTIVKTRDDWECQYDGCEGPVGNLEWHHVRYRTLNHLRWDLLNGISLCGSCHRKWHNGPKLQVWFEQRYPDRYDWVYSKPRLEGTWRESDFLVVEKMLLQKCVDLNVDPYKMGTAHAKRLIKKLEEMK
jgi:hypothetical protein